MTEAPPLLLSAVEARILGVLVEKQATTPDVYPLTINALTTACNQKTSRDPVMNLSESEISVTVDGLRGKGLVVETYGASGRVVRHGHALDRVLHLPKATIALTAVLMLRGPQTPGELRTNCDRLYRFADISSLEAYLDEMVDKKLAVKLAKQPGSREHRFAHLLCGEPDLSALASQGGGHGGHGGDLASLRAEVADLRRLVDHLYAELGVAEPPAGNGA